MFTKQCLVSTQAAGAPPTLGVAFVRKEVFSCVAAKNDKALVFFKRIYSVS